MASLPQQLMPAGVEIPPGWRHLDRVAVIAQILGDLPIVKGAAVRSKLPPTGAVKAQRCLEQPDHHQLAKVLIGVAGTPSGFAGDLVGQITVREG